eukprot:1539002-Prymnesium_polylepis.1
MHWFFYEPTGTVSLRARARARVRAPPPPRSLCLRHAWSDLTTWQVTTCTRVPRPRAPPQQYPSRPV